MPRIWLGAARSAAFILSHIGAQAQQAYPNQMVRIVVPFSAGSATDLLARAVADKLGEKWKQQVIVENRPGIAGTTIGREERGRRLHADADLERSHRRRRAEQGPAIRSGEGFRRHHADRLGAAGADCQSGVAGQDASRN